MPKKYVLVGPQDVGEIQAALKKSQSSRDRQRLMALRLGVLGNSTMAQVAETVGVSRATVGTWSALFREGGIEAVLRTSFSQRGRKPSLDAELQEKVRAELRKGRFKRSKELRAWLQQEHGIRLSLEGVYYWLGKVGGVLKVPRKTHAKKDAAASEAFKSALQARLQSLDLPKGSKVRIWMVDEHRYGLISVIRKVWTLKGIKPLAPYQTKYQWGYLYGALEVEGASSSEFFFSPTVNLEASAAFLRQLAQSDPGSQHVVIWDGAGFHQKAQGPQVPPGVHLIGLPACSPELNPVEKLFDQLKDHVGNQLFSTLNEIEEAITQMLREFWADVGKVRSLIGRGWLSDQANFTSNHYRLVIN